MWLCTNNFTIYVSAPANRGYCCACVKISGQRSSCRKCERSEFFRTPVVDRTEINILIAACTYVVDNTNTQTLQHNFMEVNSSGKLIG